MPAPKKVAEPKVAESEPEVKPSVKAEPKAEPKAAKKPQCIKSSCTCSCHLVPGSRRSGPDQVYVNCPLCLPGY